MQRRLLSKILYIPIICIGSFLLGNECDAASSASLTIAIPNMTSSAIEPGSTAIVNTKVNVSVDSVESYSLKLIVDNANITNGNTTLVPGNAVSNNTWGYKWDKDNISTYTAPSTTGTTLTVPALSNNAASFEGTLTFAAKFASNADSGHYTNTGKLSLVATPKNLINIYTLTFDKNGDYRPQNAISFESQFPKQTSPETKDEQYTFKIPSPLQYCYSFGAPSSYNNHFIDGWATSPNGAKVYNYGSEVTVYASNPNVTLYAYWRSTDGCWTD